MATATATPHATRKPLEWRRAFRALRSMQDANYDPELIREFKEALDGGDEERSYQCFRLEAGADRLIAERPNLAALMDDSEALAGMPDGSVSRAILALHEKDHIEVNALAGSLGASQDLLGDPERRWYHERMVASHDLLHVLTGYGRDTAGESALLAFSNGFIDARILRVGLLLSLFAAPKRRFFSALRYLYRAYRRGCRAHITRVARFEELLPLPVETACEILGIEPAQRVHPKGIWRGDDSHSWAPAAWPGAPNEQNGKLSGAV